MFGMVHHRQGLPFLLEPRQHGPGIHAGLDELQRHLALDRLGLLGDPDLAHPAFADLLLKHVATGDEDIGPGRRLVLGRDRGPRQRSLGFRRCGDRCIVSRATRVRVDRDRLARLLARGAQDFVRSLVGSQQGFDPSPQIGVVPAGSVQVGRPLGARFMVEGGDKDRLHVVFGSVHDPPRSDGFTSIPAPQCSVFAPSCASESRDFFARMAQR